jgi:hypothetical protein
MIGVERLLSRLKQRGLEVKRGNEPGQLLLSGPAEEKTQAVMDAVKAYKPLLLDRLGQTVEHVQAREPESEAES